MLAGLIRDQTREALLDFKTLGWCGTWVFTAGHHVADDILKLAQKRHRHEVLVDQVNLPGIWTLSGRPSWLHVCWVRLIVRRTPRKFMIVRRSQRKCMLVLALVMLDWTFVSAMQNDGNVMEAVGDTDAMLDGPSTGQLGLDENVSDGSWIWPRNERRRRSALLIELPLPWL